MALMPRHIFERAWDLAFGAEGRAAARAAAAAPDVGIGQEIFAAQLGRNIKRVNNEYTNNNEKKTFCCGVGTGVKAN